MLKLIDVCGWALEKPAMVANLTLVQAGRV